MPVTAMTTCPTPVITPLSKPAGNGLNPLYPANCPGNVVYSYAIYLIKTSSASVSCWQEDHLLPEPSLVPRKKDSRVPDKTDRGFPPVI